MKKQKQIEKKWAKHVRLTRTLYIEHLASHEPTTKDIRVFKEQEQSRKLEEKLKAMLQFLRRTIPKLVPK